MTGLPNSFWADQPGASPSSRPDAALLALQSHAELCRPTAGGHVVLSFSAVSSAADFHPHEHTRLFFAAVGKFLLAAAGNLEFTFPPLSEI